MVIPGLYPEDQLLFILNSNILEQIDLKGEPCFFQDKIWYQPENLDRIYSEN